MVGNAEDLSAVVRRGDDIDGQQVLSGGEQALDRDVANGAGDFDNVPELGVDWMIHDLECFTWDL